MFMRLLLLIQAVTAHIQMIKPIPRQSPLGVSEIKDYNIMAPLGTDGKTYPCQGKPKGPVVETWQAGTSIKVNYEPKTMHDGGHCQWSISYDNEKTFVTIQTMIRTCLHPSNPPEYTIPLPASLPACTSCVFQWTWFNAIGNREMYSNCADISITNTLPRESQGFTGRIPLVIHVPNGIGKTIPEFGNGYDGRELFEQQPYVTIGANGAGITQTTTPMIQLQKPILIAGRETSIPVPAETTPPVPANLVYIFAAAFCVLIVLSIILSLSISQNKN
jgi:hypothetical protein